jgi:hypothetical protein
VLLRTAIVLLLSGCSGSCNFGPGRPPSFELRGGLDPAQHREPEIVRHRGRANPPRASEPAAGDAPARELPANEPVNEPVNEAVREPAVEPSDESADDEHAEDEHAGDARDDQEDDPGPGHDAVSASDPPLSIAVRGERFRFRSAFAATRAGRSLFVWFSTAASHRCPRSFEHPMRDERRVAVLVSPRLPFEGDGWIAHPPTAFLERDLVVPGIDGPTEFPASIDGEPARSEDLVRGTLEIDTPEIAMRGRFEATYCGDEPGLAIPHDHPAVHAELGGEPMMVRGARVLLQDELVRLELSSSGADCRTLGNGSDLQIELRRYGNAQTEVYLTGHRLAVDRSEGWGAGVRNPLGFELEGPLTAGATVHARVSYAGAVNGVPLVLRGELDAIVCPPS